MVGCGLETLGEARMEDHWEVDHRDRLVEEWIYQVFHVNPPPPLSLPRYPGERKANISARTYLSIFSPRAVFQIRIRLG
jgi:hypothetical protein